MREKFISSIESNSLVIAKKWAKYVSSSEFTRTYRGLSEDVLVKMGKTSYENLGRFLDPQTSQTEIGKFYTDLGVKRYEEGYPLCEILYALHFTKKALLKYILSEALLPDTLTLYQSNAFMSEIYDFFDLVAFYMTRGFQESLYKKIISQKGIDKDKIAHIFPTGSFYYKHEPDFKTFGKAMGGFNLFKVK